MSTSQRLRQIALWAATAVPALVIGLSGISKLVTRGEWDRLFTAWGYPSWLCYIVGGFEVAGATALFIRRTAWVGAFLLSAIMLVAFSTVVAHPGSHFFRGRQTPIGPTEPFVFFAVLIVVGVVRWRQSKNS